jgi:hypothetical protein
MGTSLHYGDKQVSFYLCVYLLLSSDEDIYSDIAKYHVICGVLIKISMNLCMSEPTRRDNNRLHTRTF